MNTLRQEKTEAGRIIDRALAKGYLISVCDGEDFTVKFSTNRRAIMGALQTTEMDIIVIRTPDREKVGKVLFVWGNSPEEVAADYSDNAETRFLVDGVAS